MSTNEILHADEHTFEATVRAAGPRVLLDFTAERCAPCRALLPVVKRVLSTSEGAFGVVAIDVDASPALAVRFRVRGIPTMVMLEDGKEVARHLGSANEGRVRALVQREGAESAAAR
jgi:thioredoxin 1